MPAMARRRKPDHRCRTTGASRQVGAVCIVGVAVLKKDLGTHIRDVAFGNAWRCTLVTDGKLGSIPTLAVQVRDGLSTKIDPIETGSYAPGRSIVKRPAAVVWACGVMSPKPCQSIVSCRYPITTSIGDAVTSCGSVRTASTCSLNSISNLCSRAATKVTA